MLQTKKRHASRIAWGAGRRPVRGEAGHLHTSARHPPPDRWLSGARTSMWIPQLLLKPPSSSSARHRLQPISFP